MFDVETFVSYLIRLRSTEGADTPDGHTASNLLEQMPSIPGYVWPTWASDYKQTLMWAVEQQIGRLIKLRNIAVDARALTKHLFNRAVPE